MVFEDCDEGCRLTGEHGEELRAVEVHFEWEQPSCARALSEPPVDVASSNLPPRAHRQHQANHSTCELPTTIATTT